MTNAVSGVVAALEKDLEGLNAKCQQLEAQNRDHLDSITALKAEYVCNIGFSTV